MYTDRMTVFILTPFTGSRGRRADDLANSSRTEPLRTFPASRRPSMPTPRGGPRASMRAKGVHARDATPRGRARPPRIIAHWATQGHPARWPSCGRTSVDSTNVVSACITAGRQMVCARFQTQPKLSQNANAAQKSCGEDEIGCEMVRWTVSGQGCGALTVDRTPDHN